MRRINLNNYLVYPAIKGSDESEPDEYDVRGSLIEIIFAREQGLTAIELLRRDDLARKIRDCPNGEILLEEAEYSIILNALNSITGLGRPDVELVRRIQKAPKIEVEEKK